jgi:hypothetical protein
MARIGGDGDDPPRPDSDKASRRASIVLIVAT